MDKTAFPELSRILSEKYNGALPAREEFLATLEGHGYTIETYYEAVIGIQQEALKQAHEKITMLESQRPATVADIINIVSQLKDKENG